MTRWLQGTLHPAGPLPIVAVEGVVTRFAARMLEPFADDIAVRVEHVQPAPPSLDVRGFALPSVPTEVWRSDGGDVVVEAVGVHHEPVPESVAYRVTTPAGVVVVSGDTRVCEEVRDLAAGADVVVHEACRQATMAALIAGTPFETIFDYHADTTALGAMAEAAGIRHLVLTHLIPPPGDDAAEQDFVADVRAGGYTGPVTVGRDLLTVRL
jgi:ribonuclease Z